MTDPSLELASLRDWIGRSETAHDVITPRLEASLRAIWDQPAEAPAEGDLACATAHWCLAPAIAPMSALGEDGHPRRGGFLPPVPLPRRMWAGGELRFRDPLRVGDLVTRHSRIADVVVKSGRTGTLCFVTVDHRVSTARGTAIEERQDIVYRGLTSGVAAEAKSEPAEPEALWRRAWVCDAVLLFRYSALTFNGHRIHYDREYATAVEGYPGLVVHGPLQAAALVELARQARGRTPSTFSFRAVNPLFAPTPCTLAAAEYGDALRLWISDNNGRTTMRAAARW